MSKLTNNLLRPFINPDMRALGEKRGKEVILLFFFSVINTRLSLTDTREFIPLRVVSKAGAVAFASLTHHIHSDKAHSADSALIFLSRIARRVTSRSLITNRTIRYHVLHEFY